MATPGLKHQKLSVVRLAACADREPAPKSDLYHQPATATGLDLPPPRAHARTHVGSKYVRACAGTSSMALPFAALVVGFMDDDSEQVQLAEASR